jgi:quercetin dioxygenase-like cupin family protein
MRIPRFVVSLCACMAFILAGLVAGQGRQAPPAQPAAQAQQGAGFAAPQPPLLHAMNLIMMPDDPTKTGNNRVFGSSNQTGFYIARNRFGPNQTSRPHYHTMDRWLTIIKGTYYVGRTKVVRPKEMVALPAGSVMYHPAYFVHYDGSQDGQEVIVQIQGYGPVQTVQVEEDENGKPVNRGGEGAGSATTPPAARGR